MNAFSFRDLPDYELVCRSAPCSRGFRLSIRPDRVPGEDYHLIYSASQFPGAIAPHDLPGSIECIPPFFMLNAHNKGLKPRTAFSPFNVQRRRS
jgi:hypothetical protein